MRSNNTNIYKTDLRKQSNLHDYFFFNGYNFDSLMVMFLVITLLFLSVMAVSAAPNPSVIFGI